MQMVVILTGAIKNTGDFLIADRAQKLIGKHLNTDILEINRFKDLTDYLDMINESRALFLGGGPAYSHDIFDGIYNISPIYDKIDVPIIPFGLGWNGKPFPDYQKFEFSDKSFEILKKIHQKIPVSSCRDVITQSILKKYKIQNVIMTGCPAWYDLNYLSTPVNHVRNIGKIVITTPASQKYLHSTLKLIRYTKEKFSNAEIYLSFHRGILPGLHTPPRRGLSYSLEAFYGFIKGMNIKDTSGDLGKIDFYNDCDFHIGYRVHAHLHFLSQRKPSILLNEDGRGYAMSKTLETKIFNGDDEGIVEDAIAYLSHCLDSDFNDFRITFQKIDDFYENHMKLFFDKIKSIIP
jgi:hypothetical protein